MKKTPCTYNRSKSHYFPSSWVPKARSEAWEVYPLNVTTANVGANTDWIQSDRVTNTSWASHYANYQMVLFSFFVALTRFTLDMWNQIQIQYKFEEIQIYKNTNPAASHPTRVSSIPDNLTLPGSSSGQCPIPQRSHLAPFLRHGHESLGETFENTQWRKVKQMQLMWLLIPYNECRKSQTYTINVIINFIKCPIPQRSRLGPFLRHGHESLG